MNKKLIFVCLVFLASGCAKDKMEIFISNAPIDCLNHENEGYCFSTLKKELAGAGPGRVVLNAGRISSVYNEDIDIKLDALKKLFGAVSLDFTVLAAEDAGLPPEKLEKFSKNAGFKILASNAYPKSRKENPGLFSRHILLETRGAKTGFLSVILPGNELDKAGYTGHYRIEKPSYEISRNVQSLREQGADAVICLFQFEKPADDAALLDGIMRLRPSPDAFIIKNFRPDKKTADRLAKKMFFLPEKAPMLRTVAGIKKGRFLEFLSGREIKIRGENLNFSGKEKKIIAAAAEEMSKKMGYLLEDLKKTDGLSHPFADWMAHVMRRQSAAPIGIFPDYMLKRELKKGEIKKREIYLAIEDSTLAYFKIKGEDLEIFLRKNFRKGMGLSNAEISLKNGEVDRVLLAGRPVNAQGTYQLAAPVAFLENPDFGLIAHIFEFVCTKRTILDMVKREIRISKNVKKTRSSAVSAPDESSSPAGIAG